MSETTIIWTVKKLYNNYFSMRKRQTMATPMFKQCWTFITITTGEKIDRNWFAQLIAKQHSAASMQVDEITM